MVGVERFYDCVNFLMSLRDFESCLAKRERFGGFFEIHVIPGYACFIVCPCGFRWQIDFYIGILSFNEATYSKYIG
jgi:hypothetical protein